MPAGGLANTTHQSVGTRVEHRCAALAERGSEHSLLGTCTRVGKFKLVCKVWL